MKNKILYFSDCHVYGGSDRNIINLLNYMAEQSGLEVFFAYRYFKTYQMGVNRDLSKKVRAIPLSLLSNITLFHRFNLTVINRPLNMIIKLPFWFLQKIGIYALYDYLVLRKTIGRIKPDLIHVNNGDIRLHISVKLRFLLLNIPGLIKLSIILIIQPKDRVSC